MSKKQQGKRIVRLAAKDVLRLSAVEITPEGDVVTLGGKNRAGKSSVLDAIQIALAGKASVRGHGKKVSLKKPVRDGAIHGEVLLDLGDIIVERQVFDDGADKLIVRSPEGARYPRPQEMLSKLYNAVSFDPLQFVHTDPKQQVETLRTLVGLDFTEQDERRAVLYEQRTEVGREVARLRGALESKALHAGAPEAEVSTEELLLELDAANAENARRRETRVGVANQLRDLEAAERALQHAQHELERAQRAVEANEENVKAAKELLASWKKQESTNGSDTDVEPLKARLRGVDEINRKVRENNEYNTIAKQLERAKADQDALTGKIDAIDAQKKKALNQAQFPVDGLAFDENGVSFRGIPFNQCSTAEQLRISLAIGMALNPELRVLFVRDGSLLDEESLALVAQMAKESDCQVWVEDSRTSDPTAIIIEDGHVRGKAQAAE